ncbi:hypothetical protein BDQ12DRAFT_595312 [Crucibulum laeve]|uniref:Uncharacterized protein n=1 Tax=Crucibulum laeve TaxID=68775 RepID=A0A5C3MK94_9AGAR|nr:hypothetical protein BDQ12DRAFT_595312 [Crucibulum laeve]
MLRSKCWSFVVLGVALFAASAPISRRDAVDYYDPRTLSGSLLNRSGSGGEPLNVIISGKSTPEVLTPAGFLDYARAVGMSEECLGLHHGTKQLANLGDGNGWVEEREVLREHFFLPFFGTCLETMVGGNHLRVFRQDGPKANSGALFLAVSQEMDLSSHHMIIPNGYDIGRDRFVQRAVGTKAYYDKTYETTLQNITGMLPSGNRGVNHRIAQDGVIKLLTVTMKK